MLFSRFSRWLDQNLEKKKKRKKRETEVLKIENFGNLKSYFLQEYTKNNVYLVSDQIAWEKHVHRFHSKYNIFPEWTCLTKCYKFIFLI